MIIQKKKKLSITQKTYWFSENPKNSLTSDYIQSSKKVNLFFMKRSSFFTVKVDLKKAVEEIKETTLYEVNRSERDGLEFSIVKDHEIFISYYNDFARNLNLNLIKSLEFNGNILITSVKKNDNILAMHAYILDKHCNRVRLFATASSRFNFDDNKEKRLVGRANRFLHYRDMLFFKNLNFTIYDFGGYAMNTTNKSLQGINKFKIGFGGEIFEEYCYTPFWK